MTYLAVIMFYSCLCCPYGVLPLSINLNAKVQDYFLKKNITDPTSNERAIARDLIFDCHEAEEKADAFKEELGKVRGEKNSMEYELKRIKAPLAVRECIKFCEIMLSPAYKQTKQFIKSEEEVGFHEKRWIFILTQRTNEPFVQNLLDFIKHNEKRGLTIEIFAHRIAGFFHFSLNKIHVPPLESYSEGELKEELAAFFGKAFDNLTYDIVSTLRNENITNVRAVENLDQNTTVTLSTLPCH